MVESCNRNCQRYRTGGGILNILQPLKRILLYAPTKFQRAPAVFCFRFVFVFSFVQFFVTENNVVLWSCMQLIWFFVRTIRRVYFVIFH